MLGAAAAKVTKAKATKKVHLKNCIVKEVEMLLGEWVGARKWDGESQ